MKAFSLLITGLSARTITIEIPDSPLDMMMGNPLGMMGMMNSPIFGQAAMLADMKRMEQLMESEMAAMQGIEGSHSSHSSPTALPQAVMALLLKKSSANSQAT